MNNITFNASELKLQNGTTVTTVQVAIVVIAILIMVLTAGPEPSDLITGTVTALMYFLVQILGKGSRQIRTQETIAKLAHLSQRELSWLFPDQEELSLVKAQLDAYLAQN